MQLQQNTGEEIVHSRFLVNGTECTEKILNNKNHTIHMWHYDWGFLEERPTVLPEILPFVEYVASMHATGGWLDRDLFREPTNLEVLDDYDCSKLITFCSNVLKQKAKPHIKTGMIPAKLSARTQEELQAILNHPGQNLLPPYDYDMYHSYIKAIANALVEEFGLDEVRSWHWGVFDEYENYDGFCAGTPEETCVAFCKVYDYTVDALQSVLGEDIWIGTHSQTDGTIVMSWNMRDFLYHCAKETNYCTGKVGTPLKYIAISFYDESPNQPCNTGKTYAETLNCIREYAESIGLDDLVYGGEEGRILCGMDGKPLSKRIVGHTYQAGADARLLKQMIDNDIDYFIQWGYLAGREENIFDGIKTVSWHVANCFHRMVGSKVLVSQKQSNILPDNVESEIVASYNHDTNTVYVMGYNFKYDMMYNETNQMQIHLNLPMFPEKVKVTRYMVDDDANFFDEWYPNCKDNGAWSVDSTHPISDPAFLPEEYEPYTRLLPVSEETELLDGELTLTVKLKGNAVVFYVIEACKA